MRFTLYAVVTAVSSALFASAAPAPAPAALEKRAWRTQWVKPYPIFDEGWRGMGEVACGKGQYDISRTRWKGPARGSPGTFGGIPYQERGLEGWGIGTSPEVGIQGSAACGRCYKVRNDKTGRVAYIKLVGWGETFTVGNNVMRYLEGGRQGAINWNGFAVQVEELNCPAYWQRA